MHVCDEGGVVSKCITFAGVEMTSLGSWCYIVGRRHDVHGDAILMSSPHSGQKTLQNNAI